MEVLIVSKTHMTQNACVGGLVLPTKRYVRLLNPGNNNQPTNTEFNVGDVWDLTFANRAIIDPPHIEDVVISSKRFLRSMDNLPKYFKDQEIIDWRGHIDNLFDGLLNWTLSGSGYIPKDGELPSKSVGFWIADRELLRTEFKEKIRFRFPNGMNYRNITYVGYEAATENIETGTILRVSLSRIFPPTNKPDILAPKGYYLQLSGWYN